MESSLESNRAAKEKREQAAAAEADPAPAPKPKALSKRAKIVKDSGDYEPVGPKLLVQAQRAVVTRIVATPRRMCCLFFLGMLMFALPGFTQFETSDEGEQDWSIPDDETTERADAAADAITQATTTEEDPSPRTEVSEMGSIFFMYESLDGGDVFTPLGLQEMCETEQILVRDAGYEDFCVLVDGECASQDFSVVSRFYGSTDPDCELLSQDAVDAAVVGIAEDLNDPLERGGAGFFVAAAFEGSNVTTRTRSMFQMGTPLEGYHNEEDREMDQFYKLQDFQSEVEEELWDHFGMEGTAIKSAYVDDARTDDLDVRFWSMAWRFNEFERLVSGDMGWALMSILFVLGYNWHHLGHSKFLAGVSVLQTTLSLPISALIYRVFFGIDYFITLHTLVIFLVLGIGSDDVFVVADAFLQSAQYHSDLGNRLLFAYNRACSAVFNTSFTTASAFAATAASPIMPISGFGIFASICVLVNFGYVLTMTPACLAVHHLYFRNQKQACAGFRACCCTKSGQPASSAAAPAPAPEMEMTNVSTTGDEDVEAPAPAPAAQGQGEEEEDEVDLGVAERLFRTKYIPFLTQEHNGLPAVALGIVGAFLVWTVLAIVWAAQLETPSQQEKWFPDDHMFTGLLDDWTQDYLTGDEDSYSNINLIWGVRGIDRDGFSRWTPSENRGDAIFDGGFDPTSEAAQQALMDACTTIEEYACDLDGCDGGFGLLAQPGTTTCAMQEFVDWYRNGSADGYVPADEFVAQAEAFIAEFPFHGSNIGLIDGECKFVQASFVSTLSIFAPYKTADPVYDVAEDMVASIAGTAPDSVDVVFQYSDRWTWMATERGLVDGLFQGLALSFTVAFFVLLFATNNIILAVFSIVSIAGIVSTVLGIAYLIGWSLGIAESIAGVIVVGLAVDYVVHLAHRYAESEEETSALKMAEALETMGLTVVGGAVTTLGSGVFMFACQLTFFAKMATLIVTTVSFSFLYSLGFFSALCVCAGPTGGFGDLDVMYRAARNKVMGPPKDAAVYGSDA